MTFAQLLLWIVAGGLLWRLRRENAKLVKARRRTAAVMRRLKRDRDGRQISFEAACEELTEQFEQNLTLTDELRAYRDEERREERAWLN